MRHAILTYDVLFEEQPDGGYSATVPTLPGCISEGDTFEETKKNISEAITLYLEDMEAEGEKIPSNSTHIFLGKISVTSPISQ